MVGKLGLRLALCAILMAGCASPAAPLADAVELQAARSEPESGGMTTSLIRVVPNEYPIDWDDRQTLRTCKVDGTDACEELLVEVAGFTLGTTYNVPKWQQTDEDALFWRLALQVEWQTKNPVTNEARLDVYTIKPCGDGCWEERLVDNRTGTSPIVLDERDIFLNEGEIGLLIRVMSVASYATAPGADIEFHTEGMAKGYVPAGDKPIIIRS